MTSLFVPLWEESCKFWETDRNYYTGSWIGTQNFEISLLIFFWKENFSVVEFPSVDVSAQGGGGVGGVHNWEYMDTW